MAARRARGAAADPFAAAAFAWQAGTVFALRSVALWAEPAKAQAQLAAFALEKQRAFAAGAVAAGQAALRGARPEAVAAAALRPARARVRANHKALSAPKRR